MKIDKLTRIVEDATLFVDENEHVFKNNMIVHCTDAWGKFLYTAKVILSNHSITFISKYGEQQFSTEMTLGGLMKPYYDKITNEKGFMITNYIIV